MIPRSQTGKEGGDADNRRQERFADRAVIAACIFLVAAFFMTDRFGAEAVTIRILMQAAILTVILGGFFQILRQTDCDRGEVMLCVILWAGFLMRIGYMLYTPAFVRYHDIGYFTEDDTGHASYICRLLAGYLPESNEYQLYHPPLFHALAALMVKLFSIGTDEYVFEAAKLVSCCASIITLTYSLKLIRAFRFDDVSSAVALGIAAFLPNHYLLAGRVNNDALSIMFMAGILYYIFLWYRDRSWAAVIKLALCFGFGMMSKLSVGVFALPTGIVMLFVLCQEIRQKNQLSVIKKYLVFAAISFPLGLWYPIRNLVLFEQKFTYVPVPPDFIYTGDHTLWERFGLRWSGQIYNVAADDFNLWNYLLRGSLFGEFSFSAGKLIPVILLLLNLILILLSLCAMTVVLIRNRRAVMYWAMFGFWAVVMGSFIGFNLQIPAGCTMDFRYIVPTATLGGLFLAAFCDDGRTNRILRKVVRGTVMLFSMLSIAMFTNIS